MLTRFREFVRRILRPLFGGGTHRPPMSAC